MEEIKYVSPRTRKRDKGLATDLARRPGGSYRCDYRELVELLNRFTDEVGEDENHPLASLMDVLGVLIQKFEDEHMPELTDQWTGSDEIEIHPTALPRSKEIIVRDVQAGKAGLGRQENSY